MVLLFHILVVGGLATSKKTGFVVTVVVHGRIGPVSCLAFGHHGFAHGLTGVHHLVVLATAFRVGTTLRTTIRFLQSQVDAAWDAIKGQDKFNGKPLPIRALGVLYPNHMHVVTVDGTGISKVEDLKGKRVSTGSPGSATEVFAFRIIEAAGLDPNKDTPRERLGVAESVNALKDKKIEAFFWVGGLPTAAVTDLAATPNTQI